MKKYQSKNASEQLKILELTKKYKSVCNICGDMLDKDLMTVCPDCDKIMCDCCGEDSCGCGI